VIFCTIANNERVPQQERRRRRRRRRRGNEKGARGQNADYDDQTRWWLRITSIRGQSR